MLLLVKPKEAQFHLSKNKSLNKVLINKVRYEVAVVGYKVATLPYQLYENVQLQEIKL